MSALHAPGRAWQAARKLTRPRWVRKGAMRRFTAVTAPTAYDRTAAAVADMIELDAELRGLVRPLCGAAAQLAGQDVFCARPRHTPDDPEHYGVVWLQVDGRSCLGAVTWSPARPS